MVHATINPFSQLFHIPLILPFILFTPSITTKTHKQLQRIYVMDSHLYPLPRFRLISRSFPSAPVALVLRRFSYAIETERKVSQSDKTLIVSSFPLSCACINSQNPWPLQSLLNRQSTLTEHSRGQKNKIRLSSHG